jgi:hypothetical protein
MIYELNGRSYYGDELMQMGLPLHNDCISGYTIGDDGSSVVVVLKMRE